MNREFLQLAHTFDPNKHSIGGWYVSEKLDGMRAYWDGGISRGMLTSKIPYANTAKDYRRITPPRATGLWSRYAKPIAAPDWFLDLLPENVPLDGELYLGPGQFQKLISTVKKFDPLDSEWEQVSYMIFDCPSDYEMFKPGKINNPNCKMIMPDCREQIDRINPTRFWMLQTALIKRVQSLDAGPIKLVKQIQLPMATDRALDAVEAMLDVVMEKGGEGLMVRNPDSIWVPKRTYDLLKIKKWIDSEAMVTGYTWGKGKLEGLMGALKVVWRGKHFELSGFTDAERVLTHSYGEPGEEVACDVSNDFFPRGSVITFKYKELTRDGVPKEARYYRKSMSKV